MRCSPPAFRRDHRRRHVAVRAGVVATSVLWLLVAQAVATVSPTTGCARYHAGVPEGDGEYTKGAMYSAHGISCRRAWRLVRPNYARVRRALRRGAHGFGMGAFRCRFQMQGPVDLKVCRRARVSFVFL